MKDILTIHTQDNDPLKTDLLIMLQNIQAQQLYILKKIENLTNSNIKKETLQFSDSPLKLFIHDDERLNKFINRLSLCATTKEWAQQAVYPLYEEEYLTSETIHSRRFIEATIPYCENMSKASYDTLRKQLKNCYFPK